MTTQPSRQGTPPHSVTRTARAHLGHLTAVLVAIICGGLPASAAAVPGAFANPVPSPGGSYGPGPATPATVTRVITTGGMPGWQITLIAPGAAPFAASVAVLLDRARSGRRRPPPRPHGAPAHDACLLDARQTQSTDRLALGPPAPSHQQPWSSDPPADEGPDS